MGSVDQRVFESYFVKGPTVDCEDDILVDINILWALDLYVDVCLFMRLAVGWVRCGSLVGTPVLRP